MLHSFFLIGTVPGSAQVRTARKCYGWIWVNVPLQVCLFSLLTFTCSVRAGWVAGWPLVGARPSLQPGSPSWVCQKTEPKPSRTFSVSVVSIYLKSHNKDSYRKWDGSYTKKWNRFLREIERKALRKSRRGHYCSYSTRQWYKRVAIRMLYLHYQYGMDMNVMTTLVNDI